MSWSDVWKIILSIVASVGGIGAIICFVIKFSSDIIADRLSKKYELKMNKEIESYRNKLDQKNYISKARFDKEFEIYQDLSEKILDMTFANYVLFPVFDKVPPNEEERQEFFNERYKNAVQTYNDANRTIKATAPFIPEDIYKLFSELRDDCCKQIDDYTIFVLEPDYKENRTDLREEYKACWTRTKAISEKRDNIISNLRKYLSTLEVLD
jgi:hypothetical protein